MTIHCFNQYGVTESLKKPECIDAQQFFKNCLHVNGFFANMRDRNPEYYLNNTYSRYKPHFSELAI